MLGHKELDVRSLLRFAAYKDVLAPEGIVFQILKIIGVKRDFELIAPLAVGYYRVAAVNVERLGNAARRKHHIKLVGVQIVKPGLNLALNGYVITGFGIGLGNSRYRNIINNKIELMPAVFNKIYAEYEH